MRLDYLVGGKRQSISQSDPCVRLNITENDGHVTVSITAFAAITLISAGTALQHPYGKDDLVFANGYQSWTETRQFSAKEGLRNLSRLPAKLTERFALKAYGSQYFEPAEKNTKVAFDLFEIIGTAPLFIGNLNYKNAYLIIRPDQSNGTITLKSDVEGLELAAGESFTLFDYVFSTDAAAARDAYFARMKPVSSRKLLGYTSWYNHYQNINEQLIDTALREMDSRFELFQIDDGFEPFVGDWLVTDPQKFPQGLGPIVQRIHDKKMLAGIWLAPFAAEQASALVREHPDWIRRDQNGAPVMGGCNWSGFYALDLDKPEVISYVRRVLKHYADLGFDFFKLDFLYAATLSRMQGKTRAQTAEYAYSLLREELGDRLILGCGATLANGFERFDYMRIGPDVCLRFDDHFYMRVLHPERVSTRVTLCNTIFRHMMDGHAFGNDPDVFLLRDENIHLTPAQRYALTTVNALFGSLMMTSDDPGRYDSKKKDILEKALLLNRNAKVTDTRREGDLIHICYTLNGQTHSMDYHMKKGIIQNER